MPRIIFNYFYSLELSTTEKRAAALCEAIRQSCPHPGDSYPVTVEWVKSATWGSNPRILHRGEKVTSISGCGYCKHSACLASALSGLGETEEARRDISITAGAGVSSVRDALKAAGWLLECVASGKSFDAYTVTRA